MNLRGLSMWGPTARGSTVRALLHVPKDKDDGASTVFRMGSPKLPFCDRARPSRPGRCVHHCHSRGLLETAVDSMSFLQSESCVLTRVQLLPPSFPSMGRGLRRLPLEV